MTESQKLKRIIIAVVVILLGILAYWLSRPCLLVQGEMQNIACFSARPGLPIVINFIHSVQKTPVEEDLHLDADNSTIVLDYTVYHSFGVGLPFLEGDGQFRQEGNNFIMDNMNRRFPSLSLRTGLGTELTLTVDGNVYELYQTFDPGHKIDIYTAPRVKYYLDGLLGR